MGRAPCCDKTKVKKGPWSPEEDATLKNYLHKYGTGGNWIALPGKAGLKRCGKSCRLRWLNYLRPNIKHGGFTEEEDSIICDLYNKLGSRWSVIASQLQGRTDNDVKNHWNTKLKKKLLLSTKGNPKNNPILHSSTPSMPLKPKIEAHSPSFSAVLTQNCCHGLNVNAQSIDHDPINHSSLQELTKFSEFNAASAKKSSCRISSSQEASSILNSDDNYSSWCGGNGGEDQNDGFSMDFGTGFSYDLINIGNWHQEMVSELVGSSHAIS